MTLWEFLDSLGISVNNKLLIENAFVHASYVNENSEIQSDNERLEFMGDAVLQILVSEILYNHPDVLSEGDMTLYRARLVREEALVEYSRKLDLSRFLKLGQGEEFTGGREKDSIVADLFEAVVGAVYLDSGLENAKKIIDKVISTDLSKINITTITDYKTKLQEYVQSDRRENVSYEVVKTTGPSNAPEFEVVVKLNNLIFGKGTGTSKKRAEQEAAKDAFEKLVK
ncbi:MAG: ribonuclease III [Erysipelothrix sp.]|nr:ribonuclease III [Erysipelothrix sp.]